VLNSRIINEDIYKGNTMLNSRIIIKDSTEQSVYRNTEQNLRIIKNDQLSSYLLLYRRYVIVVLLKIEWF